MGISARPYSVRTSGYIKVYLLRDRDELWERAQRFVDWVASTVGTEVRELRGDNDLVWAAGGAPRGGHDSFFCTSCAWE